MTQTPSQLHTDLVKFGVDVYHKTFIDLFVNQAQGGQIPGIEVDESKMRGFFDQMPPEQWTALAAENPTRALAMLNQYRALGGGT